MDKTFKDIDEQIPFWNFESGKLNFLNGKTGNWEINLWNFNVESGIIDFWILESEKWNLESKNCERKLKSEKENLEI